jgi:hypothetical protein
MQLFEAYSAAVASHGAASGAQHVLNAEYFSASTR